MKTALITGITGQNGSYLAEFSHSMVYRVQGIVRRVAIEDLEHKLWRVRHKERPEDYVIATGETHSITGLVEIAFSYVGLEWKDYVVSDEIFNRPAEINELKGDFSKAKKKLGWEPKVTFGELIRMMVDCDLKLYQQNIVHCL